MPDNKEMIVKTDLAMIGELRKVLKRLHYPLEVMLERAINLHGLPQWATDVRSRSVL